MSLHKIELNDNPWLMLELFEERISQDPNTDLLDFLPESGSEDHSKILLELIRLDMEFSARRQSLREPDYYFNRFPQLRTQPELASVIVFESYRLLRRSGQELKAGDYAKQFDVSCEDWPSELDSSACSLETRQLMQKITPVGLRFSRLIRSVPRAESADHQGSSQKSDSRRKYEHEGQSDLPSSELTSLAKAPSKQLAPDVPTSVNRPEMLNSGSQKNSHRSAGNPNSSAMDSSSGIQRLPSPGEYLLNFELLEILGNGSFGRVYLAQQRDLADRLVAIKLGQGLFGESHTLAQLQHTNIVPIYSVHTISQHQAICMPYFGRCTLAHWVMEMRQRELVPRTGQELVEQLREYTNRQSEPDLAVDAKTAAATKTLECAGRTANEVWAQLTTMSYSEVVNWLAVQLAAGLEHAHARGIIHRDLKPANILLTDDGVPMLLDFNVAQDLKRQTTPGGNLIGGTLPFMAPEQLRVYAGQKADIDHRMDLYALGVVLFELLTGRHPFPDHKKLEESEIIQIMLQDRAQPLPNLRTLNPEIPRDLEAIVQKLLAYDVAKRYQSASDLKEDLERQSQSRPLKFAQESSLWDRGKKWIRRNPWARSNSTITVAVFTIVLACVLATYAIREQKRSLQAQITFEQHRADFRDLQSIMDDRSQDKITPEEQILRCQKMLARYELNPYSSPAESWKESVSARYLSPEAREQVRETMGEVFYLMAKTAVQRAKVSTISTERDQQLELAKLWNSSAELLDPIRIRRALMEQRHDILASQGKTAEATTIAEAAKELGPNSPRDRYLLGYWHYQQGQIHQALPDLIQATAEDPSHFSAWFVRGNTHLRLEQNDLALMCYTASIALRPDFAPAWFNRGQAFIKQRLYSFAKDDFNRVMQLDPSSIDGLIMLGGTYQAQGDYQSANDIYTQALARAECPTRVHFYRATVREALKDIPGAQADRTAGMKREPTDELSWIARAEARLAEPESALQDVDAALRVNPMSLPGLQLKAHLLAEQLKRPLEAIEALDRAIKFYPDSVPALAGRGVLLARQGERARAHADAEAALSRDSRPQNLFQVGCIFALTTRHNPADRFRAVELLNSALARGFGREYLASDTDLDPLRQTEEFKSLISRYAAKK